MPACEPVTEMASRPCSAHAIDSSDIASRSPHVSSMSSSRRDGDGLIDLAFSMSWFVVLPIADTTTTTFLPAALVRAIRFATSLILSASATDEPPYFWTTIPVGVTGAPYDHPCSLSPLNGDARRSEATTRKVVLRFDDGPSSRRHRGMHRGDRVVPSVVRRTALAGRIGRPARRRRSRQ